MVKYFLKQKPFWHADCFLSLHGNTARRRGKLNNHSGFKVNAAWGGGYSKKKRGQPRCGNFT